MSLSKEEMQVLVAPILEGLGVRIKSGQLVIHIHEYKVQHCETNLIWRPQTPEPLRKT